MLKNASNSALTPTVVVTCLFSPENKESNPNVAESSSSEFSIVQPKPSTVSPDGVSGQASSKSETPSASESNSINCRSLHPTAETLASDSVRGHTSSESMMPSLSVSSRQPSPLLSSKVALTSGHRSS